MTFNTRNPLGSTDPRDLFDNAGIFDWFVGGSGSFYPDRFGVQRLSLTGMRHNFQQFLLNSGYEAPDIYVEGLLLERSTQTFVRDNIQYRIKSPADLPYTTTGDWVVESSRFAIIGDGGLRQELAADDSGVLIGGEPAADIGGIAKAVSIDSDNRVRGNSFISGEEVISGSARRDAFIVGRNVVGLTDCHGFSDRTVMSGVTDYGGYGSFDVTVQLQGGNNHNHIFSYQDRATYSGSGILQNSAGFLSRSRHTGTGIIEKRIGIDIAGTEVTSGGLVSEQTGVLIRDISVGSVKVGIAIAQSTGFSIYANGGARGFHRGPLRLGVDDASTVPFSVGAVGAPNIYFNPLVGGGVIGVSGDNAWRIHTNAATRLEIVNSANSYALRPGADNSQPLGDSSRRWSQVFAGTATISTSDAREKTDVRRLTDSEISAAKDLAREIGVFRFLSAVAEKGDSAREHIGMTVQRAIEILESHGLNPFSYSFICYDEWSDEFQPHPAEFEKIHTPAQYDDAGNILVDAKTEDGELIKDAWDELVTPAGNRYSFRFEGLLAFIAAGFEARLAALEVAA